jgi:hypothetical protein
MKVRAVSIETWGGVTVLSWVLTVVMVTAGTSIASLAPSRDSPMATAHGVAILVETPP